MSCRFFGGAIFAVALYPLFYKLQSLIGGREKLAATIIALVVLALLMAPIVFLSQALIKNSQTLSAKIQTGSLTIPPPSDKVKEWPLVGARLHHTWLLASNNLDETLDRFTPQLEAAGRKLLSFTAGVGMEIFRFIVAIIIYGFSVAEPLPATLFTVWSVFVGVSDTFLKPLLLGRGMEIPMLVILLGAIGGMVLSGIIGLFIGAVVLAVRYKLFFAWLDQDRTGGG